MAFNMGYAVGHRLKLLGHHSSQSWANWEKCCDGNNSSWISSHKLSPVSKRHMYVVVPPVLVRLYVDVSATGPFCSWVWWGTKFPTPSPACGWFLYSWEWTATFLLTVGKLVPTRSWSHSLGGEGIDSSKIGAHRSVGMWRDLVRSDVSRDPTGLARTWLYPRKIFLQCLH